MYWEQQEHFDFLYRYTNGSRVLRQEILDIILHVDRHYHEGEVLKSSGEVRKIDKPSEELKKVQREILREVKKINRERGIISECVFGLGGNDTKQNVLPHVKNRYVFRIDLKNFFNGINFERVKEAFKHIGCSDDEAVVLAKLTTHNYYLPQGSPTSSILSSVCLVRLDERIENLCRIGMVYTRYIDDITISSVKNEINDKTQKNIRRIISSEGLRVNRDKTKVVDTKNELCEITGIMVQNGRMMTKYHCGQEKHAFIRNSAIDRIEENSQLRGVLNWVRNVDPNYYDVLMKKGQCPYCT